MGLKLLGSGMALKHSEHILLETALSTWPCIAALRVEGGNSVMSRLQL